MLRRPRVLALPLGVALGLALGACGSDDGRESGATVPPLSATGRTVAPAATVTAPTATTAPATVPTTTLPTATSTTPTNPSSSSGGATTTHSSGGAPAGCPPAVGGFVRDLHGSDCGVARSVAQAWFDAVHGGAAPDSAIDAAGYGCSGTLSGERASVTCRGSGGSVSFTASP